MSTTNLSVRPLLGLAIAALALTLCASCNKADDSATKTPAASAPAPATTAMAPSATPAAPDAAMQMSAPDGSGLVQANFKVEGMHCEDCTAAITQSLSKINGVKSVQAQWQQGTVNVNYEPTKVKVAQMTGVIEGLKYKVTSCSVPGCPGVGTAINMAAKANTSDPASFIMASTKLPNGHMTATYKLSGMMCTDCENKVMTALKSVKGVDDVKATWKDGTAVVTYDPAQATPAALLASLHSTGFTVQAADGKGAMEGAGGCPAGKDCASCADKDGCKDGDCKDCKDKAAKDDKAKAGGAKPKADDKSSHA